MGSIPASTTIKKSGCHWLFNGIRSSQTDTDSSTEHEDAAPSTQPDAEEATENADTQSATQPEEKTAGE